MLSSIRWEMNNVFSLPFSGSAPLELLPKHVPVASCAMCSSFAKVLPLLVHSLQLKPGLKD